jgi:hypothetical protein
MYIVQYSTLVYEYVRTTISGLSQIVSECKYTMSDYFDGFSTTRPITGHGGQAERPQTAAADANTDDYFAGPRPITSSRSSAVPATRLSFSEPAVRPLSSSGRPLTSMVSRPGTAAHQQTVPEWLFQESRLRAHHGRIDDLDRSQG